MTKLLDVQALNVQYGGVKAVKGIDFYLNVGEIVALVGANGAGKSSTLRAICKLAPHSGTLFFDGVALSHIKSHELVRLGIALVPEGRGIFSQSTVEENLLMGAYIYRDAQVKTDLEKMYRLFPRLKERCLQSAGTLSGGEQQMVALARALMSRPKLLLLDEPSMGLAPLVVKTIFEVLKQIAAEGMTIFLVEQNAGLALTLSSRGYVMESGSIVLNDSAPALLQNPQIKTAYLGQ
jgi:branched-chain amino acid transport system ATP-binding protein